jgi:DNA replication and repair protein RecF
VGLLVQRIRLADFRNYEQAEFELGERLTVIGGPNAAGKTSIVEAIQLTTAGQSFRNPAWKETIRRGAEAASVLMTAAGDGRSLSVSMEVDSLGRRAYAVSGSRAKRVADVRGNLPSVVFGPDDLAMVKGSAEKRRALLDTLGDQLSRTYESLRREYDRILKQRNAALKEGQQDVVDTLGGKLAETGAKYTAHRMRLLERITPRLKAAHAEIAAGEDLTATYKRPWAQEEVEGTQGAAEELEAEIAQALETTADEERARGSTLVGPHRDDVLIDLGGVSARIFASQGQQRSIALSWKLAEVSVIKDVSGEAPVLLLDDVMSELDEERRAALVARVDEKTQTVVTTTNLHYFDEDVISRAHVLELGP